MFHHHDGSIGDIDPNLDDGCSNQDLDLSFLKLHHDGLFLIALHPAMKKANPKLWKDFLLKVLSHSGGILKLQFFRLLYERIDDEGLAAFPHFFLDDSVNSRSCRFWKDFGLYGHPTRWHFVDQRNIEVSINRHRKGPRDRSCRHHQDIRVLPFLL